MESDVPTPSLAERLEAAAELMESIIEDRGLVVDVDEAIRVRFLTAAGRVSRPDKDAKTRLVRARQRKAFKERKERDKLLFWFVQGRCT